MTPTQAQDLKQLAEGAKRICPIKKEPIKWFTESEMLMQMEFHEDDAAYIAAMSPDVALQLLADRAMLLEAMKYVLAVYDKGTCGHTVESAFNKIRAAIAQCEGNP